MQKIEFLSFWGLLYGTQGFSSQKVDGVGTKWGEVSIKKSLEKNGFEWINLEYSWNVDPSLVLLPGWKTEASATPFQPPVWQGTPQRNDGSAF